METKIYRTIVLISICVTLFATLSAFMILVSPPEDQNMPLEPIMQTKIEEENYINPATNEEKNELNNEVPDVESATSYPEQTWNVTGISSDWINMRDELDDLKHQLNDGEGEQDDQLETIFYYENGMTYLGGRKQTVPGTHIKANNSVVFLVAYEIFNHAEENYNLWLYSDNPSKSSDRSISKLVTDEFSQRRFFVFPSTEMMLSLEEIGLSSGNWEINYKIMVQGTAGTTVTILNPPIS